MHSFRKKITCSRKRNCSRKHALDQESVQENDQEKRKFFIALALDFKVIGVIIFLKFSFAFVTFFQLLSLIVFLLRLCHKLNYSKCPWVKTLTSECRVQPFSRLPCTSCEFCPRTQPNSFQRLSRIDIVQVYYRVLQKILIKIRCIKFLAK